MNAGISFRIEGRALRAEAPRPGASLEVPSVLGPAYEASFACGREIFAELNEFSAGNDVFMLADRKVLSLYGKYLKIAPARIFAAPADERFKTLGGVGKLLAFLDRGGASKSSKLLVIGGGIMQDAGGFAATLYKRGVEWAFAPTTLLSMCDSCIGAKTGINFGSAKNQLGVFAKPCAVHIDPRLLRSLEHRHIRSGLGEILKMCVIGGPKAMSLYRSDIHAALARDNAATQRLVGLSLAIKKAVVSADELECSVRKALNYGHTVGHALEALSNFKVSHGEGVALGMIAANALSVSAGLLDSATAAELENDCLELCAGVRLPRMDSAALGRLVMKDKKTSGGRALFAVPRKLGDFVFVRREPSAAMWRLLANSLTRRFNQV